MKKLISDVQSLFKKQWKVISIIVNKLKVPLMIYKNKELLLRQISETNLR
jgi:hypothetical protein